MAPLSAFNAPLEFGRHHSVVLSVVLPDFQAPLSKVPDFAALRAFDKIPLFDLAVDCLVPSLLTLEAQLLIALE